MQVMLVRDSGGAALIIAEIVEPLLGRASELQLSGFVRQREVKRALEEYQSKRRIEALLRDHLTAEREAEIVAVLMRICMKLERITTFDFRTMTARAANRKPVVRPFDQVRLALHATLRLALAQLATLRGRRSRVCVCACLRPGGARRDRAGVQA